MIKIAFTLLPVFVFFVNALNAQKSPFKFGEIDEKYFEMTHCPYDSSAGAIVLQEYGESTIDHNYEVLFLFHARIKILDKSEFDRADISIPYFKRDRVRKLEASTYNMVDGKIEKSEVTKDQIYKEDRNEDVQVMNFTFPKVQEGSIIEYTYMVNYGSWTRLNTWYFQSSIPTLYSQYHLEIPEFFHYKRLQSGFIPLTEARVDVTNGYVGGSNIKFQRHNYIAENVPAFKDEPYMTSKSNYISKIEFELDYVEIPGQPIEHYLPSNYYSLSRGLAESEYFGGKIKNTNFVKDEVQLIKDSVSGDEQVARSIFEYVQNHIERDGDVNYESLRKVLKEGKGSISDINLILAAMYREAGFTADPVRLSTRANGRIHPTFPIASKFNYTLCKLNIGESHYLLDASEPDLKFGVIPKRCTNGAGLVISEENPGWVDLTPYHKNDITYFGMFNVDENAMVSGRLQIARSGYEALDFNEVLEDNGADKYKEDFANRKDLWLIEDHEITDIDDNVALKQKLSITAEDLIDDLGEILYLNPIATGRMTENPFKADKRVFPVNFGAPYTISHVYTYTINDNLIIESVPQPFSIALPNKGGTILYQAVQMGNRISVTCKYSITKSEYLSDEYLYLKEFYAQLVEKQGQQIVLKRK